MSPNVASIAAELHCSRIVFFRIVKLLHNYRSHESILSYPNRTFYSGELEVHGDPAVIYSLARFEELVTPGFPIIFHAISGMSLA
jgi:helicase MOV-10